MLHGHPVVREAFARTIRLVSTARLRESVLRALVDSDEELVALAEVEGATSARLIGEARGIGAIAANEFVHGVPHAAFINASFAYSRPRELNRFNGPDSGAWYAALRVETCLKEVAFHMSEFLARTGEFRATVDYAELFASLAGEFVDLREADPATHCLSADITAGHPAGNVLAAAALARGLNGIVYPSVRHKGGTCIVALRPHAVQSVAQGDVYRLIWDGDPEPKMEKVTGS